MDNRSDKTEDRQITKLRRTQESTKRFQDHIVLVAEINWRRLGDRRTAGLGLAAVRHHWLTQRLPSLSNLFLCAIVPLALPAHSPLSLSLFSSCFLSILPPSLVHTHSIRLSFSFSRFWINYVCSLPMALFRMIRPFSVAWNCSAFFFFFFPRFDLCLWLTYDRFLLFRKVKDEDFSNFFAILYVLLELFFFFFFFLFLFCIF